jgi:hypothetical protein
MVNIHVRVAITRELNFCKREKLQPRSASLPLAILACRALLCFRLIWYQIRTTCRLHVENLLCYGVGGNKFRTPLRFRRARWEQHQQEHNELNSFGLECDSGQD